MRTFSVFLFLLVLTPFSASASGQIAICDMASSTAAMMGCVKKHHDEAQTKLNRIYDDVKAGLTEEDVEDLHLLQEQWIAYRDAECAWEAAQVETESLIKIYELSCIAKMTDDRAARLLDTFQNASVEGQAELGGFPRWMNALSDDYPDVFWRFGQRERVDLNCDDAEEIVMLGAAVSRVQTLEKSEGDEDQGRTPLGMDVVVAVMSNPPTGRPTAQLFRLPITESLNGPSLCSHDVSLRSYALDGTDDHAEGDEKTCVKRVDIQGKNCSPVTLGWSGKDYALTYDVPEQDDNQ